MRTVIPILGVLLLTSVGCLDGSQRGQFDVSSHGSHSLKTHTGSLVILRGQSLSTDYQTTVDEKALIYCLIICPGLQAIGSGNEGSDDTYRSTHKSTWFASPKDVAVEFVWDRRDDTVEIYGKLFNRADGNIFVVVRESADKIFSSQIESIDADATLADVMRHIRETLSDNEFVANAELIQVDGQ